MHERLLLADIQSQLGSNLGDEHLFAIVYSGRCVLIL